ncbi:MAG TPA: MYG1 family protein [Ramlibacter sp.]|uniref:MYG1 family protein n=1 Tax=Ramlibacter sp. TaxID=1917967 RepID=UPI002ED23A3F
MTKRIATHSGSFHADDIFGVAVLASVFPDHEIVRTRDEAQIATADFVVDVGGRWDPAAGRFDHHQREFDGARTRQAADGRIERAEGYASAGLVWREFGPAYVRQVAQEMGEELPDATLARIANDIDAGLVRYLDLVDTGEAMVAPGAVGLSTLLSTLNSNWVEEEGLGASALAHLQLRRFQEGMAIVQLFLERLVRRRIGQDMAAAQVRGAERLLAGRVLFLAKGGMPWTSVVLEEMPQVLLVLYPEADEEGQRFVLRTVPAGPGTFASRMDLPQAWAGLRDGQLAAVTGVTDAVFTHTKRFIAVARSFEGALRLAELALVGKEVAHPTTASSSA